jgi:hypothetical protein
VLIISNSYWNHKTNRVKLLLKKVTFSEKPQEASYLVAELIAQKKKSHTVGENLIMPACKIIVSKVLAQNAVQEMEKVLLSNSSCIYDMSHDAEKVWCNKLKNNSFAIQLDESTDVTSKCHVMAFVKFVNGGEFKKTFSAAKSCPKQARAKIYFIFCLHIRNQKVCLGGIALASVLMVPHQYLAP